MALEEVLGVGNFARGICLAVAAFAYYGSAITAETPRDGRENDTKVENSTRGSQDAQDKLSSIVITKSKIEAPKTLSSLILPDTLKLLDNYSTSTRRINFDRMQAELRRAYNYKPHTEDSWQEAIAKDEVAKAYALAVLMKDDKPTNGTPYRLFAHLELNFGERWNGTGSEYRYLDGQAAKAAALRSIVEYARRFDDKSCWPSYLVINQHPSKGIASEVSKEEVCYDSLKGELLAMLARISHGLEDYPRAKYYRDEALKLDPSDPNGIDCWFRIHDEERKLIRRTEEERRKRASE